MNNFWRQLEGAVLDGKYILHECLSTEQNQALFRTEFGDQRVRAAIKVMRADLQTAEERLSLWRSAAELSHPNLIRILAAERFTFLDIPLVYVVMDYADDSLRNVLRERSLKEAEALEVLESTLSVLAYIHDEGFVHGHIKPENILAVGDKIKISSDGISRADATLSPAKDVQSLGTTIFESLTQRLPGESPEVDLLPGRFREIVAHSLCRTPDDRWSVAQISASLRTDSAVGEPLRTAHLRKWGYAAAAAAVILIIALVARKPDLPRKVLIDSPPAQSGAVVPAPKQPAAIPPRRADRSARPVWRVIVYTYTGATAAEDRAQKINAKWPDFKAEVFSPNGDAPPHLVTIGGAMDREQALALRRKARSVGLPRDTYAQNFSR